MDANANGGSPASDQNGVTGHAHRPPQAMEENENGESARVLTEGGTNSGCAHLPPQARQASAQSRNASSLNLSGNRSNKDSSIRPGGNRGGNQQRNKKDHDPEMSQTRHVNARNTAGNIAALRVTIVKDSVEEVTIHITKR